MTAKLTKVFDKIQPVWRWLLIFTLFLMLSFPVASVQAQALPLEFDPDWGPQMYVGEIWSTTFTATGGYPPLSYSITYGNIPGVFLVGNVFSGTPTISGFYQITVTVTDSAIVPQTVSETHNYYVAERLVFDPGWGSQMYVGDEWSSTFSASGGVTPYTYSLSSGSIPGLTFSAGSATYSGTPTTIGTYPVAVRVTDSAVGDGETITASNSYDVMSHTDLAITDFASSHPLGEFRIDYPVWVLVDLNADVDIPASPAQEVEITSDHGGPSCIATIGTDGTGECALSFTSVNSYTITATFAASTYFEASATTADIQILADNRTKSLSAGRNHTCMLDELGNISCWGLEDSYNECLKGIENKS